MATFTTKWKEELDLLLGGPGHSLIGSNFATAFLKIDECTNETGFGNKDMRYNLRSAPD